MHSRQKHDAGKAIASRTDLKVEQNLDPNPAYFKTLKDSDRRPVERVSWYDAIEFCVRLSKLTRRDYRLPSEAEWEYACRAGTTTPFSFGETLTDKLANYHANYTYANESKGENRGKTTLVGQFPPNKLGLYDIHGNVWEWCADYWHENYHSAPTDDREWISENKGNRSLRVIRGGSWDFDPWFCRSAIRGWYSPDVRLNYFGFRVACGFART